MVGLTANGRADLGAASPASAVAPAAAGPTADAARRSPSASGSGGGAGFTSTVTAGSAGSKTSLRSGSAPPEGPLQPAGAAGTSTNWAGYAATGATFTAARASWRQPPAECSALGAGAVTLAGFWVGLDGYSSSTVEQIGTQTDCEGSTPVYYAWFELFPHRLTLLSDGAHPLHAGDLIHAEVTQGRLRLRDATAGWTEVQRFSTATPAFSSAEWVAESPSSLLTDFGAISFASASASTATAAGRPIDGGGFAVHRIDLGGGTGASASTGPISDGPSGSSFQVRFQHG